VDERSGTACRGYTPHAQNLCKESCRCCCWAVLGVRWPSPQRLQAEVASPEPRRRHRRHSLLHSLLRPVAWSTRSRRPPQWRGGRGRQRPRAPGWRRRPPRRGGDGDAAQRRHKARMCPRRAGTNTSAPRAKRSADGGGARHRADDEDAGEAHTDAGHGSSYCYLRAWAHFSEQRLGRNFGHASPFLFLKGDLSLDLSLVFFLVCLPCVFSFERSSCSCLQYTSPGKNSTLRTRSIGSSDAFASGPPGKPDYLVTTL
jgi:hypothetical protein